MKKIRGSVPAAKGVTPNSINMTSCRPSCFSSFLIVSLIIDCKRLKQASIYLNNINSPEDAKELTQNIFKLIWERRTNLRISSSIENYLMRSAKLQVINYYRNTKYETKI